MKTIEEVRTTLTALVGYPPHQGIWAHLSDPDRAFVANVQQGISEVEELLDEYRALERLYRGGARERPVKSANHRPSRSKRQGAPTRKPEPSKVTREQTVSRLAAYHARDDAEVVAFRKDVLHGKPLAIGDIDRWIRDQAKRDGDSTKWAEVAVPSNRQVPPNPHGGFLVKPEFNVAMLESYSFRVLRYRAQWEYRRLVAVGGVLERLWRLSKSLSKRYSWDEGEATTFVLTGRVPSNPIVRETYAEKNPSAFSRIVLEVDPAATPAQVARQYREFRKMVLVATRTRACSEKHMMLALFSASLSDESLDWPKVMKKWNAENPKYKYTTVGNFKRDCQVAHDRLLYPKYVEIPPEADDEYDSEPEVDLSNWELE